ncbi:MAG: methylenetetrahydrofolate reductase [Treponema sp.]|jgi:methylenetetrahydrofolate reductase (NADPH)|nr:methylenetetrahydrofolate reductase [Treponema sp.]
MKIAEILKKRMTLSFEVFPPKNDQPIQPLLETLNQFYRFDVDFISCTYGAGGTNRGRSLEICEAIQKSGHIIMTHFSCIGNSKDDIKKIIQEYTDKGIENVLAMRGDFPKGQEGTGGDFDHADKLIAFLKAEFPTVSLACAGYPEKHILAPSFDADIAYLRSKQDAGAEFVMLQLCHDIAVYEQFARRCRRAGITIPLIIGLMPVLAKDPIVRMALSNGCSIPKELAAIIGKYGGNSEDFKKAGIEYTIGQLWGYMNAGVSGIHIYTLNKYEGVARIILESGIRVVR